MHPYTFTFTDRTNNEVTITHTISDEMLLGIGFGVYIFNKERGLDKYAESIKCSGNVVLVEEMFHDALMPGSLEECPECSKKYVTKYGDGSETIYPTFGSTDFIQGAHTAFNWLNAPGLYKFTREIYDTDTEQRILVN